MIDFYFRPTPNPAKLDPMLEETGLEYELRPVDTKKGERHLDSFLKVNPSAAFILPGTDDPLAPFAKLKRWFAEIDGGRAAIRARAVGTGYMFKQEMDAAARHGLLPSNYPAA
ncbi:hypothetical protein [Paraburkholderia sp. BL17N1]|uniref:hypothetical protein n=1 Tax=Paraburkholderia sp. BL17N1 TaxID=1938798 RepID=UPI000EB0D7EC|nr:hypothetical protein [Paraburkholderia sp. BL17N1]RKR45246.1 glutathione S-transferase-like protein [Paraburkholderia sp. BL17N1]